MSSLEQVTQPSVAVSRDRSRAIFGQTMGLVALTCAVAALGAYLGRDISRGWGIVAFIGAIACIIGLNVAIQRSEQLAIGLLFGLGAFIGHRRRADARLLRLGQPAGALAGRRHDGALHRRLRRVRLRDATRPLEDRPRSPSSRCSG